VPEIAEEKSTKSQVATVPIVGETGALPQEVDVENPSVL